MNDVLNFFSGGLLSAGPWALVLITLAMTHVTIVSVTVYLHRYSAHRALELHPALKHFFRFWLWLTTGQNTRAWTAIHRTAPRCWAFAKCSAKAPSSIRRKP